MNIFESFIEFFKAEKVEYWHRNRTIEIIALEMDLDIQLIKSATRIILQNEGRVEAISKLRHRFHVSLSTAWRFIDKLDVQ